MSTTGNYLQSVTQLLQDYKRTGELAIRQIPEEKIFWQYNADSNSVAIIVKHLWGNMLSRWTDFLDSNGEKSWRERDEEFEPGIATMEELWFKWEEGWRVLFAALEPLTEEDLTRIVVIGHKEHSVVDAISRQLAHYAAHIGQIIYLAKMLADKPWESLSVPKGKSPKFN
ncbi:MAG TPA: DUF1572 family protein [Lunatimonas sp.]|nr:DUF1572 family protein [Lunatimonas sp.]